MLAEELWNWSKKRSVCQQQKGGEQEVVLSPRSAVERKTPASDRAAVSSRNG